MTALKNHREVKGLDYSQPGRWRLTVNGDHMPADANWTAESRFGKIGSAVVVDKEGKPLFDKPWVQEAKADNIIAWGFDENGTVRIGIIREARPHADLPGDEHAGIDGHQPVVFGQIPMGYAEKIFGGAFKSNAANELAEEAGATVILGITKPSCPWHNPNPTFVRSWTDLVFAQVDLARLEQNKPEMNESIFSVEWLTVSDLFSRIRDGQDEEGAYYRMCTANSALLIFFATYPEFLAGVIPV